MNNAPLVYLVTPVFNSVNHTTKFLKSLKSQTYNNFKTVIVDDGSTDGTYDIIKNNFPEVIIIRGNGDLWWSGGTNVGIKRAQKDKAKYVLTINNDVVIKNDYIESLVRFITTKKNALVGSVIYEDGQKNKIWFAGGNYNQKKGIYEHKTRMSAANKRPFKTHWLTGMGVMLPIDVFEKIGLYDDKIFPQYFGDADFSERAKKSGYKLWINPRSIIYADISENWISKSMKNPRISFVYDVFFSKKSPLQIKTRKKFYKLYWPGNYRIALLKFYTIGSFRIYINFVKNYIRKFNFRDKNKK